MSRGADLSEFQKGQIYKMFKNELRYDVNYILRALFNGTSFVARKY